MNDFRLRSQGILAKKRYGYDLEYIYAIMTVYIHIHRKKEKEKIQDSKTILYMHMCCVYVCLLYAEREMGFR